LGIKQQSLLPPAYFQAFIPIKKLNMMREAILTMLLLSFSSLAV